MDNIRIVPGKRWLEVSLLLISDLAGFGIAIGLVAVARHLLLHVEYALVFDANGIRTLQYLLLFSLVLLLARGLYPGWKRSSIVEFKQIVEAITLAYVITSMIIFIQRSWIEFSRSVFILSWFFTILTLPVGRFLLRKYISRYPWWGEPVVVIGTETKVREVVRQLAGCPRLGLRPSIGLVADETLSKKGGPLPILLWSQERQERIQRAGISTCVLAIPSSDLRKDHPRIFRQIELGFRKTVFILNDDIFSFMLAQPLDIAGLPAILSRQSLFDPGRLLIKRMIDYLFVAILIVPILIVGILLAILIRIDSPGPILYTQERVGRNRKMIRIYKFRTMVQNADEVLTTMLRNPGVRAEWETYHKLTDDLRITRAGNFLRRYSLDELPQVINILRGEMSLIGPRPLAQEEIDQMGESAQVVLHVLPGITGWWQVMGRNNLSFLERTRLDMYYVFNWSLWLDLFIVIKTFWVVLFLGDGK